MWESLLRLDGNILLFIQDMIRNPFLDPIMKIITSLGNAGILWIIATILLLIPKRTRKVGVISACALLASLLVNNILLKNLVARVRPYYAVEGLTPIVTKPSEFSFPSGHAAISFASAGVFYRKLPRKYGVLAVVMAGLISLSRPLCRGALSNGCADGNPERNRVQLSGRVGGNAPVDTKRRDAMRIKHGIPLDNSAPSGAFLTEFIRPVYSWAAIAPSTWLA